MKTIATMAFLVFFAAVTANASDYTVNPSRSQVRWNGKKVTGEHHGTINVKSGTLEGQGNELIGGQVEMDMNTISDEGTQETGMNSRLVTHLKSDDFFSVAKFPAASLKLTKVKKLSGNDLELTGDLTIKDITHPVTFTASLLAEANAWIATGKITINRAKYDVRYRSGTFFQDLGDKLIYDDFTLDFRLVAERTGNI